VVPESGDERPRLTAVESVRCLECGAIYAKPVGGGTVRQNPGCPECGYVGWVAVNATPVAGSQTRRFAEDRLRHQGG
jgi:predicted  nucleic acid-binding Zn-ribbon protein